MDIKDALKIADSAAASYRDKREALMVLASVVRAGKQDQTIDEEKLNLSMDQLELISIGKLFCSLDCVKGMAKEILELKQSVAGVWLEYSENKPEILGGDFIVECEGILPGGFYLSAYFTEEGFKSGGTILNVKRFAEIKP